MTTFPFRIGYNSYTFGKSIDENFFDDGTDEALQWVEGWLEAERYDISLGGQNYSS